MSDLLPLGARVQFTHHLYHLRDEKFTPTDVLGLEEA